MVEWQELQSFLAIITWPIDSIKNARRELKQRKHTKLIQEDWRVPPSWISSERLLESAETTIQMEFDLYLAAGGQKRAGPVIRDETKRISTRIQIDIVNPLGCDIEHAVDYIGLRRISNLVSKKAGRVLWEFHASKEALRQISEPSHSLDRDELGFLKCLVCGELRLTINCLRRHIEGQHQPRTQETGSDAFGLLELDQCVNVRLSGGSLRRHVEPGHRDCVLENRGSAECLKEEMSDGDETLCGNDTSDGEESSGDGESLHESGRRGRGASVGNKLEDEGHSSAATSQLQPSKIPGMAFVVVAVSTAPGSRAVCETLGRMDHIFGCFCSCELETCSLRRGCKVSWRVEEMSA